MNEVHISPAGPADATGIADVHVRAWREAYAHLASASALAALNVEDKALRWVDIINDQVTDVWAAKKRDNIVGWATASRGRDADAPRPTELEGIYVLSADYGTGVGQRLLDAAIGDAPAYLWMAADNSRAGAFYRRNGFAPDGVSGMHDLAGTSVSIIRWVR